MLTSCDGKDGHKLLFHFSGNQTKWYLLFFLYSLYGIIHFLITVPILKNQKLSVFLVSPEVLVGLCKWHGGLQCVCELG